MRDIAETLKISQARPSRLLHAARGETAAMLAEFAAREAGRAVAVAGLEPGAAIEGIALDELRPAASSLKLALAGALLRMAQDGAIDLNERVAAGRLHGSKWPSVLDALEPDAELRLRDLMGFAITTSDNGASDLLFQRVGVARIAQWLHAAGCGAGAKFVVGYGDHAIEGSGRLNVFSLRDAVLVLRALLNDAIYVPVLRAMLNNVRNQRIPRFLDDDVWVAHKTGSLNGVVNDIGIVFAPAGAFILSVLTVGQESSWQTEHDIARLAEKLVALNGG